MGKSSNKYTKKADKRLRLKIGKRYRADVSAFNGQVYIHLSDSHKGKSVSLSKKDLIKVLKKTDKLQTLIHTCEKQAKLKKAMQSDSGSSSDDGSDSAESTVSDNEEK